MMGERKQVKLTRRAAIRVQRDCEQDDRHACAECVRLTGHGAASWRCGNWQRAGVTVRARDVQLPGELVHMMQRCDEFFKDQQPDQFVYGTP